MILPNTQFKVCTVFMKTENDLNEVPFLPTPPTHHRDLTFVHIRLKGGKLGTYIFFLMWLMFKLCLNSSSWFSIYKNCPQNWLL